MFVPSFLGPLRPIILTQPTSAGAGARNLIAPTGGSGARRADLVAFSMQPQEDTQWCWAAVTASVATFYHASAWTSQCVVATRAKSVQCCNNQNQSVCNLANELDTPLSRTGHFDLSNGRVDHPQAFSVVEQEITTQRAFACRIVWTDQTAHFVAISGCSVDASGDEYVEVADPLQSGPVTLPLDDFTSSYQGQGSWENSYFTLKSSLPPAGGAAAGMTVGGPVAP